MILVTAAVFPHKRIFENHFHGQTQQLTNQPNRQKYAKASKIKHRNNNGKKEEYKQAMFISSNLEKKRNNKTKNKIRCAPIASDIFMQKVHLSKQSAFIR